MSNRFHLDCCCSEPPFTPEKRLCCDHDGEDCHFFRQKCRDCFWPDFSHPTWLCCRVLYGCCRRRREEREEDRD